MSQQADLEIVNRTLGAVVRKQEAELKVLRAAVQDVYKCSNDPRVIRIVREAINQTGDA